MQNKQANEVSKQIQIHEAFLAQKAEFDAALQRLQAKYRAFRYSVLGRQLGPYRHLAALQRFAEADHRQRLLRRRICAGVKNEKHRV